MLATKSVFIPDSSLWSLLLSKVLTDLKDLMVLIYAYLFYCGVTRNRALQSNNRALAAKTPGLYSRRHQKRDPNCNEPQKLNKKLLGFYYETFL